MRSLYYILSNRSFLMLMLVINVLGTAYGYYWYRFQLQETPTVFLAFVPDSPTASLFFVIVLFAFLLKKNWPLFEALAAITLFKYGIWAVVMNLLVFYQTGIVDKAGLMLIFSHGAMALQGLLYAPFYRIKVKHLIIAAIWTLHNDIIDYVFFMMPSYKVLDQYMAQIGYFTFWLSIASIAIIYYVTQKKDRLNWNLVH
ncbi:DUF1405 domain-containing protein [Niallia sp. 01092]|uniref:DUF1405 domain-containing protein n=1 Tax=unclassified Niallia TaxID=2837522 RepID=UPI003FD54421